MVRSQCHGEARTDPNAPRHKAQACCILSGLLVMISDHASNWRGGQTDSPVVGELPCTSFCPTLDTNATAAIAGDSPAQG